MAVEPGLVDDGASTSERRVAMPRNRVSEQGHRAGIGAGQSQQQPDERGLAGAVRAEVTERGSPGDQQLDTVHGSVRPEALGEPVGLHGPAALAVGRKHHGSLASPGRGAIVRYGREACLRRGVADRRSAALQPRVEGVYNLRWTRLCNLELVPSG